MSDALPAIAIVIPFLDEAAALPATLAALERARRAEGAPRCEVVAVDAGSADASRDVLARYGIGVIDAPRGRASQMNAGAAATRAPTILFLHADTLLPGDGLCAIVDAARRPGFVYGGFHHRFDGHDWRLAAISWMHNLRCAMVRTYYGDQAMFVARDAFERAGGFPPTRVEDIDLSQKLRTVGAPAFVPQAVVTSARKFVALGVWRSFALVLAILVCHTFGWRLPASFFADVR
jgi:rSAM/selenodomain-associated transferase 2